jgi:hypothetical protein
MSEDQNLQSQDELSDEQLVNVAGGTVVLEERPNPTLGGPDTRGIIIDYTPPTSEPEHR